MSPVKAKLNAPEVLGDYLKRIGIETVHIYADTHIGNESKKSVLFLSFQDFSRLHKEFENLFSVKDGPPK